MSELATMDEAITALIASAEALQTAYDQWVGAGSLGMDPTEEIESQIVQLTQQFEQWANMYAADAIPAPVIPAPEPDMPTEPEAG